MGTAPGHLGVGVSRFPSPRASPAVPAWHGSWPRRPCQAGWISPGSGSRSAGSPGGASAALEGQRGLSHSPPKPLTSPSPEPPVLGAQTYGAAVQSHRPGAGRICGSSSRPWCAGRCGISPAGLQGGVSVTVARGRDPGSGGGGSQSVLTVADDPSQGLALEVELHVHVLALRDGAGVRAGDPAGSGSPAPAPPDPLPTTPCQVTHEAGGVVVADGFGVSEGCGRRTGKCSSSQGDTGRLS